MLADAFNPPVWQEIWEQLKILNRIETGISFIDDAIHGIFPGEICLIGAKSGSGKTELASSIALHVASQMKKVLYVACEAEPGEIEKRILWKIIGQTLRTRGRPKELEGVSLRYADWRAGFYTQSLYETEAHAKLEYIANASELRVFYPFKAENLEIDGPLTGEKFAKMLISPLTLDEYSLIILDHFHSLSFQGKDLVRSQGEAINAIRIRAEEAKVPVLIFGQFRKTNQFNKGPIPEMEEFSGSSELYYRPQNIIVFGQKKQDGGSKRDTYFHIVKARSAGDVKPFVGVHYFDTETNTYTKRYDLRFHQTNSDPVELSTTNAKFPPWAKRATKPSLFGIADVF